MWCYSGRPKERRHIATSPKGSPFPQDYTGVSTREFHRLLIEVADGDFETWLDNQVLTRSQKTSFRLICEETHNFTPLAQVDRLSMLADQPFLNDLTVVPSPHPKAAQKMAFDILRLAWENANPDMILSPMSTAEEKEEVEKAFVAWIDGEAFDALVEELEALRDNVLGEPTPTQQKRQQTMRDVRVKNLNKRQGVSAIAV